MSQPSQPSHPMLINLPQPPSNPDTPSEMPGTPTSTTTSLSALSTTAIKDGHRGHALATTSHRGHAHHASTNSLEAERADRISRLAGLSGLTSLRPPHTGHHAHQPNSAHQPTPTSAAAAPAAYFDANGQPTAANKISTVGTASATESVGGRTVGEGEVDEDIMSMDTNFRETEVDSTSGYLGGPVGEMDAMDEDLATRSVGGFEDRMSDDGEASLVGFGEGAGSTVSGPIYHRRPLPQGAGAGGSASAGPGPGPMAGVWGLERSSSGLSDGGNLGRRELIRSLEQRESGGDTPVSITAALERREARMVDGVATDGAGLTTAPDDDMYIDTTTRSPVPVGPPLQPTMATTTTSTTTSAGPLRESQLPPMYQRPQAAAAAAAAPASREALESIVRGLDNGEARMGNAAAMTSPGKGSERLGRFYFEDRK